MCPFDPPADLVARRGEIVDLWHDHQKLRAEHEKLQGEVERLRLRLAKKTKQVRGHVSERRKPKTHGPSPAKTPPPGHGPREQEHLEEREEVLTLDEADKVCTACGGELGAWDGQFEESTEIDVEERVYVKKRIKRQKYRCRCGACIETAPPPEKLIPGGTYSLAFAIEVAHDKYVCHEPLERQARRMRRAGLEVESQTLWDQTNALAYAYEPAYERIWKHILRALWIGVDETGWPMLGNGGKTNDKEPWWAWLAHREHAVVYMMDDGRTYEQAKVLLEGYKGTIVCDGLDAYEKFARLMPGVRLAQCWVHTRRNFLECETGYPEQAGQMIRLIAELYALEDTVPPGREHDAERLRMRQAKSREALSRIEAWVWQNGLSVPKESLLRKATQYLVRRWVALTRFTENPALPLDNNASEREARAPALGRKNHYGSRTRRGAEVSAYLYTVVETAMLSGVEPKTYLRFAALRSLRDRPVVLPHELTAELLIDELGITAEAAARALAYQKPIVADAT